MEVLDHSTRFLRHQPYRVRLLVTISTFLSCVCIFAFASTFSHEASILALPIALAAWLFKRYEPWLYGVGAMLAIAFINSRSYHGFTWPHALAVAFLLGSLALAVEIVIVSLLRHALEESEAARKKVSLAEQQLAQAYEQQRQLNLLKDQFIANVNHELRTPLTEVHGYLELLRSYHRQLDEETRTTFIENAARGCEDLKFLVDTVLEVTWTVENPSAPKYELVPIRDTVHAVLRHLVPESPKLHPLHIDIPESITAWCNREQLWQILRNLISNALKYSPPHMPVQINCTPLPQRTHQGELIEYVCICVKDAGPGIAAEDIPRLFERFVRLDRDLAGSERGSGLGLYMSKLLVEGMGGSIWVESAGVPGAGTCFFFTLPMVDPNTMQRVGMNAAHPGSQVV